MGYPMGERLADLVEKAGLQEFRKVIAGLVNDQTAWAGDAFIQVNPEQAEAVRLVLYSVLHEHGVKQLFRITKPLPGTLVVSQVKPKQNPVLGIQFGVKGPTNPSTSSGPSLSPGETAFDPAPLGDEGLKEIF